VSFDFDRARALLAQREFARAKDAFVAAMLGDRYNLAGMLGLAEAFVGLEEYPQARVVLMEAVARHPEASVAWSALGGVMLELDELDAAREAFETALRINPTLRKPWAGLGVAYERSGETAEADRAWREAFRDGGPAVSAFRGDGEPLRVLLLCSAVGGNVPIAPVFDDRMHEVFTLFAESFHETMALPEHDIAFNAVADADIGTRALDKAEEIVRATTAPVINPPAHVRLTGRVAVAERLRSVPGIVTPQIRLVPSAELASDTGLPWPVLLRAPGFHSGEHFVKADDATQLGDALAALPFDHLLAIEFVDTRGADGLYRKYRMLAIDGGLYPSHLAISDQWKVHYFSAQHGAALEEEEARFLEDPAATLGSTAVRALQSAVEILALEYVGFDFALDALGRVVLFEANATMRIGANAEAIDAVRAMLAARRLRT
jgi:hypothetical protein